MVHNGVYKPAKLYEYNGGLYAAVGGGFVRLKANGATSHPQIRLEVLHRDGPLFQDRFGRIRVMPGDGSRELLLDENGTFFLAEGPAGEKKQALPHAK